MKKQITKLWLPTAIEADDLTIEHSLTRTRNPQRFSEFCEGVEGMAVAGNQLSTMVLDDSQGTKPVVLQLKDPLGMVEGQRLAG